MPSYALVQGFKPMSNEPQFQLIYDLSHPYQVQQVAHFRWVCHHDHEWEFDDVITYTISEQRALQLLQARYDYPSLPRHTPAVVIQSEETLTWHDQNKRARSAMRQYLARNRMLQAGKTTA